MILQEPFAHRMAELTGMHHCAQLNDSLPASSFLFPFFSFQYWELKLVPATHHMSRLPLGSIPSPQTHPIFQKFSLSCPNWQRIHFLSQASPLLMLLLSQPLKHQGLEACSPCFRLAGL